LIRPGEQIPLDRVVVEGASSVNEAFLTGEPRPVPKDLGAEVIACPHALGLAIPLVIVNATTMSARHGILVRNREAFERARQTQVVAFDKTGTLTEGQFRVRAVYTHGRGEREVIQLATVLETRSEHPLAEAIGREAAQRGLLVPPADDFKAVPGRGP
jgi:Cu2+-exporting ATPase